MWSFCWYSKFETSVVGVRTFGTRDAFIQFTIVVVERQAGFHRLFESCLFNNLYLHDWIILIFVEPRFSKVKSVIILVLLLRNSVETICVKVFVVGA